MKEANRCNVPTGQQRCPVCDKVRPSTTQLRRHLNDSREAGHISWRNNEREKAKAASDAGVPMPPGQRATGGPAGAFAASTPPYPPAPPPPAYSDVIAGAKPKNAIERIRNLIPDDLAKALERADLPDLSYCPANVREIWESVGGLPRLIPARELYPKGEEHTEFGLFDRCLDALPGDVRMFVNGLESRGTSTKKKTGLRRRLAYWYSRPMCEESKFALSAGIWLPHDELMEVPQSAGGYTPQHEEATEAIWAPPGNITDSHIDHGKDVISRPVPDCEKAFLFHPRTASNLAEFRGGGPYADRMLRGLKRGVLKGGLISLVPPGFGVYLPAGTIHSVVTIVGGFLVSRNFYNARTIEGMSAWLHGSLVGEGVLSGKDKDTLLRNWIKAAEVAENLHLVLAGWQTAKPELIALLNERPRMKAPMAELWRGWFTPSRHGKDMEWRKVAEEAQEDLRRMGIRVS